MLFGIGAGCCVLKPRLCRASSACISQCRHQAGGCMGWVVCVLGVWQAECLAGCTGGERANPDPDGSRGCCWCGREQGGAVGMGQMGWRASAACCVLHHDPWRPDTCGGTKCPSDLCKLRHVAHLAATCHHCEDRPGEPGQCTPPHLRCRHCCILIVVKALAVSAVCARTSCQAAPQRQLCCQGRGGGDGGVHAW